MLKENIKELELHNMVPYLDKYGGEGHTIVILDDASMPDVYVNAEVPFTKHNDTSKNHCRTMCRIARELLHSVRIVALNYFSDSENSINWIIEHKDEIDVVNCSFSSPLEGDFLRLKGLGIPLVCSTGNDGMSVSIPARLSYTIGVSAWLADYSYIPAYANYGEQVDCIGSTAVNVYIPFNGNIVPINGTSAVAPLVSSMIILYNQDRKIKLSDVQAKELIHKNCIDVLEAGFDIKSGYGIFRLPELECEKMKLEFTIGSTEVLVDGIPQQLLTAPIIKDKTTLIPLRFVSESMRAKVDYTTVNGKVNKVFIELGGEEIEL